jgi:hypothetical protein
MVTATHLVTVYCDHENEFVRRYRVVLRKRPAMPASFQKGASASAPFSSYPRRFAHKRGLVRASQLDFLA